jgi:hypothetical protein
VFRFYCKGAPLLASKNSKTRPHPPKRLAIPLFGRQAAEQLATLTKKYELPGSPTLAEALNTLYFGHTELWSNNPRSSAALKRYAGNVNNATKKYMSILGKSSDFAGWLSQGDNSTDLNNSAIRDINTLPSLLRKIVFRSNLAQHAKASRGRGKSALAVSVAAELQLIYDAYHPSDRHGLPKGRSRSIDCNEFVHDALALLGINLTEDTVRTYRQKKHQARAVREKRGEKVTN